jgi:hypothetical protein
MIHIFEAEEQPRLPRLAALHGRLPIFAKFSIIRRIQRQEYIETGFDTWTSKPTIFRRLDDLMRGVHDAGMRNTCAYGQAMGEKGVAEANEGPSEHEST